MFPNHSRARFLFIALLILWNSGGNTALAATLNINLVVTNIAHHVTPVDEFDPTAGNAINDELQFAHPVLTNLSLGDFSSFRIRLLAPPGKAIAVNAPGPYHSSVTVVYSGASDSGTLYMPTTLEFDNFSGTLPIRIYSFFCLGDLHTALYFMGQESFTNNIRFTGFKYTFTPTNNPGSALLNYVFSSASSIPVSFSYFTPSVVDPGPFVTLTNFPHTNKLTVNMEITNITHQFYAVNDPNPDNTPLRGRVNEFLKFSGPPLVNVDPFDYDLIEFRLFMTNGLIQLVGPAKTNYVAVFNLIYTQVLGSSYSVPGSAVFENLTGNALANLPLQFTVGGNLRVLTSTVVFQTNSLRCTAIIPTFAPNFRPPYSRELNYQFDPASTAGFVYLHTNTVALGDPGRVAYFVPDLKITYTNHAGTLKWQAMQQQPYQLQSNTNLSTTNWQDLNGIITGNGHITNTVMPTDGAQNFYRLKLF